MSDYDGSIYFKDWLPDHPDLGNPGLTQATNVLPKDFTFKAFRPLTDAGSAGPSRALGAIRPSSANNPLMASLYVGFDTSLQILTGGTFTNKSSATYNSSTEYWRFAQFDELVIATNKYDVPQRHTIGAASNFTALAVSGTAPKAQHVGVIGEFAVLGNLVDSGGTAEPYSVCWPAISDPTNWPTPNSSTAIAVQSGRQRLDAEFGEVTSIVDGDQYGIIAQRGGLTRMTYVGPPVVFSFDTYEKGRGSYFPNAGVKVGNRFFFISLGGICVTDGVNVEPIGAGKTDRYFLSLVNFGFASHVYGAVDYEQKLIFWGFPAVGPDPDTILIFNYEESRFASASQSLEMLISAAESNSSIDIGAFSTAHKLGAFTGTAGSAVLTTAELEPNAGGYTSEIAIKPLADQTLNGITIAMGTRNDRTSAVSYTAEQTANSRSGFANFRTAAKYHRARLTISGTFNAAQGLEYQAVPDGYT